MLVKARVVLMLIDKRERWIRWGELDMKGG
jgi:hypothetical protein